MAGNGRNGWKRLEIAGNSLNGLKLVRKNKNWLEIAKRISSNDKDDESDIGDGKESNRRALSQFSLCLEDGLGRVTQMITFKVRVDKSEIFTNNI